MASVLDVAPRSALKDGEALSRALWWLQRTLGEAGQWGRAERVSPSDNFGGTRGRCRASCTKPDPNKWKAGHSGGGAQEPLTLLRAAAEGHCPDPACQHWCHSLLTILFHSGRRCCPSNVQRRKLRLEGFKVPRSGGAETDPRPVGPACPFHHARWQARVRVGGQSSASYARDQATDL